MSRVQDETGGLAPFLEKQLLQDIELTNTTRSNLDFLSLCNDNTLVYGKRGSETRRLFQQYFKRLKKRTPQAYNNCLFTKGVQPGPASSREFRDTLKAKKMAANKNKKKNKMDEDDEDDLSTTSSEGSITSYRKPPPDSATKSTKSKSKLTSPTPSTRSSSRNKVPDDILTSSASSPPPSTSYQFATTSSLGNAGHSSSLLLSWSTRQDGSMQSPWLQFVDIERPEVNREFGIQYVLQMTQGQYERNGFHIRMTVAALDWDKWEAVIPKQGAYPAEYNNRLVLVKGPSFSYFEKNSEEYHKGSDKNNCTHTTKAHTATELEIEKDTARQWTYYLLVFPHNIVLDNSIFSDDDDILPIVPNPVISLGANNAFDKDIRGMVVYWCIAIAGGRKVSRVKDTTDLKLLFKE
jgi:hypothetical protein